MGRAHEVRAASMAKTAAAKSKLNNKYSRSIYVAAKSGIPDPELNLALKHEIEKAKREQVNADTIKRAIEKAKGGSMESYFPVRYEGFGPNNSMLIIECLTDNENRTLTAVKTALSKCGCKLGVAGCVRHMFNYYAVFSFEGMSDEEALEAVMMADVEVEDVLSEDGVVTIYAESSKYNDVKQALLAAKSDLTFLEDLTTYVPQTTVELTDEKDISQFSRLQTMLDDIDDVQDLFHNIVNLPAEEE
ncbi:MAG: YebC/PmpR family DNA-binding transcriptional regulator [Bacilli bacterium]|nr:YebC/PmpR family DNA-binding transcriptional regulator [Bacilli bacterium]